MHWFLRLLHVRDHVSSQVKIPIVCVGDICALLCWKSSTVSCNDHMNPIWIDTVCFWNATYPWRHSQSPPSQISPSVSAYHLHTHHTYPSQDFRSHICILVQSLRWGEGDVKLSLDFKPQCVRLLNPLSVIFFLFFSFSRITVYLFYPHLYPPPPSPFLQEPQTPPLPLCVLYNLSACPYSASLYVCPSSSVCLVYCLAAWVCLVLPCVCLSSLSFPSCLSLKSSLPFSS